MLVHIQKLSITLGPTHILKDVNIRIKKGSLTAVVGESGSGKTTLALSLLGLVSPVMKISAEVLDIEGQSVLTTKPEDLRHMRANKIGFIFQEPLHVFDPLFTFGYHMNETLRSHTSLSKNDRIARIKEVLALTGLSEESGILNRYPHQISGGQRQRAMVALACVCYPPLIIADEPTSSLDVLLQAEMIKTFKHLNKKCGITMLLITHDLGLVVALADHVVVLKDGCVLEEGEVHRVIKFPKNPYTKRLLEASQ